MKNSKLLILSMLLLAFMAIGCSHEEDLGQPENGQPTAEQSVIPTTLNRADKAGSPAIVTANLHLFSDRFNDEPITIHQITAPWDEMTVTWGNFGGAFDPTASSSFMSETLGWETADVTSVVQAWLDNPSGDFGLLLDQDNAVLIRSRFNSREATENHPWLEVVYSTAFGNQTVILTDIADAYIWEYDTEYNTGARTSIYTARSGSSDLEKQALLKFDTSVIPELGALGDYVWLDANENGLQDVDEFGIPMVTVNLLDCDGNTLATTTTDANGFYLFDNLPAGDYGIQFVAPLDYEFSPQMVGTDDGIDSDADLVTGMTACISLATGETNLSLDAGLMMTMNEDCGDCDGKISQLTLRYEGTESTFLKIYDDKKQKPNRLMFEGTVNPGDEFTINGTRRHGEMHSKIFLYEDGRRTVEIHTSCSVPIGPGMTFGNFYIVEGYSRHGGLLCPVDIPDEDECGECDGKVSELTMRYEGAESKFLQIYDDKRLNEDRLMFEGTVNNGDEFVIYGTRRHGEMDAKISLFEDGQHAVEIHTSCSVPIGPGMTFGNYFIVEGYSRNGGLLCPVENQIP